MKSCEKRRGEQEHMIRSMGNGGVIGGEMKMKAMEQLITGSSLRINRINKTAGSATPLMNHKNR